MIIRINKLVFILIFFTLFFSYGQDTTYYNLKKFEVKSGSDSIAFYEISYPPDGSYDVWKIMYNINGQKVKETKGVKKNKFWEGYAKEWYSNGQLKSLVQYINEDFDTIRTFWENGTAKRFDTFKAGKLTLGTCYDKDGEIIPHFPYQVMPEFPGGMRRMNELIRQNLNYPKFASQYKISGEVLMGFCVENDGTVCEIKVVNSVHKSLDDEAVRVIKLIPAWHPGKIDGISVRSYYVIPIVFTMPDYKPFASHIIWVGKNNEYLKIRKKKASLQHKNSYREFDVVKYVKNKYLILSHKHFNEEIQMRYNITLLTKDSLILVPEGDDIFALSKPNEQNQYVFVKHP